MVYMYFIARRRKYPIQPRASLKEIGRGTWAALPAIFMPVIILGGILGGIFTPTEAAGVAVIYALIVDVLLYKQLNLKSLWTFF